MTRPPSISGACVTSSTLVTGEPLLREKRRCAARGDELPAELDEAAREIVDTVLVPDADQRTRQRPLTTSGSKPMLDRVDPLDQRRARLDRDRLLQDHRAGVEAFVHVVDGDAGGLRAGRERVVDRVRAGERAAAAMGGR